MINKYAVNVPVEDQWNYTIPTFLLYLQHKLTFKYLISAFAGGEHRIFFTRIFSLSIFIINNKFNTLLQMKIQSVIPALLACLLCFWHINHYKKVHIFSLLVILTVFAIPNESVNILRGDNSYMYFMVFFSTTALYLSSKNPMKFRQFVLILLTSICAFFSNAGGMITPFTLAITLLLFSNTTKKSHGIQHPFLLSIILLITAFVMFKFTPHNVNLNYYTHSIYSFAKSFIHILIKQRGAYLITFLPFFYGCYKFRYYKTDRLFIFAFSLYLWVLLQIVAIAHTRGIWALRYNPITDMSIVAMVYMLDVFVSFDQTYIRNLINHGSKYFCILLIFFTFFIPNFNSSSIYFFVPLDSSSYDKFKIMKNHREKGLYTIQQAICFQKKGEFNKAKQIITLNKNYFYPWKNGMPVFYALKNQAVVDFLPFKAATQCK